MIITIPITPVAKPRMTQGDKWKKRPRVQRYWAYKAELCLWMQVNDVTLPNHGWHITFYLPMPASWPDKKRHAHEGYPHMAKPDKDNLEKGFLDALFADDSCVWDGRVTKLWSKTPRITITLKD